MICRSHLQLHELHLSPSAEWQAAFACWCFVRLRCGQSYWLGAREVAELAEGEVVVVPPQRPGTLRASQLNAVELVYFLFCPELLSGLLTLGEIRRLEMALPRRKPELPRFKPGEAVANIFACLDAAHPPGLGLTTRSLMLQVAGACFDAEWPSPRTVGRAFLPANKRIRLLMQQLTEAEILQYSVAELAERCNCSPRHFNRLFLQNLGTSFRARQTELRLVKARQLLAETEEPVATVALAVGYKHPALFHAHFKRQFGANPTDWRHTQRES